MNGFVCEDLSFFNINPFFFVTYDHVVRRRSWSKRCEAAETVLKPVWEVMLCGWWNWKIIHSELLPSGHTLNSGFNCQQLNRLKLAIYHRRPELDNRNRLVFCLVTRQKLRELRWETLMRRLFSADLQPGNYHIFQYISYGLNV